MRNLTHLDSRGQARMVDVGSKPATRREAAAYGELRVRPDVLGLVRRGALPKGDALACARLAGMLAAKRVDELIPLCHSLSLSAVRVDFELGRDRVRVRAEASAAGPTGVEMEALTAVSVACLTLYDMLKSADKGMTLGPIYLLEKKGGRSGHYRRADSHTVQGKNHGG